LSEIVSHEIKIFKIPVPDRGKPPVQKESYSRHRPQAVRAGIPPGDRPVSLLTEAGYGLSYMKPLLGIISDIYTHTDHKAVKKSPIKGDLAQYSGALFIIDEDIIGPFYPAGYHIPCTSHIRTEKSCVKFARGISLMGIQV
jgi:hypothetical protein